jgi:hypothetical protein
MKHRHSVASQQIVWQKKIPETLLDLYFNHVRMLPSWKVSFPNYVHPAILDAGPSWVARSIEEFNEGEWIAELTHLDSQLVAHEGEQAKKEEALQRDELRVVDEIKEKLSKLPPLEAEEGSWFRRLLRSFKDPNLHHRRDRGKQQPAQGK